MAPDFFHDILTKIIFWLIFRSRETAVIRVTKRIDTRLEGICPFLALKPPPMTYETTLDVACLSRPKLSFYEREKTSLNGDRSGICRLSLNWICFLFLTKLMLYMIKDTLSYPVYDSFSFIGVSLERVFNLRIKLISKTSENSFAYSKGL